MSQRGVPLSRLIADLGLADMTPPEAASAGAKNLFIGIAPVGGALRPEWCATLIEPMRAGPDLVSGMRSPLADVPELTECSAETGLPAVDPIATGAGALIERL